MLQKSKGGLNSESYGIFLTSHYLVATAVKMVYFKDTVLEMNCLKYI